MAFKYEKPSDVWALLAFLYPIYGLILKYNTRQINATVLSFMFFCRIETLRILFER